MSLQVRLAHVLGERIYEIPTRTAENPFIVGRGQGAGLQVPSLAVAMRHCALFTHKGKWCVQTLVPGGTLLNGVPLTQPVVLKVGDQLTIGNEEKPAMLEIDPAGVAAGKKGLPVLDAAEANQPTASPPAARQPAALPIATALPMAMAVPMATPIPQPLAIPMAQPLPEQSAAAQKVKSGTGAPQPSRPVRRKKKNSSPIAVTICVLITIGIVGGTTYFVVMHRPPPPVVVMEPEPAPVVRPKTRPAATMQIAVEPTPVAVNPQTQPSDATEVDPHANDPDWPAVQEAHYMDNPAPALLRFDDYEIRNPGKNVEILKQYENDAMDRLWWRRIAYLCKQRDDLATEVAEDNATAATSGDAAAKATAAEDKADAELRLKGVIRTLTGEMDYTAEGTPDPNNEAELAPLRAARDPARFAQWTDETARYIRHHYGQTPWGG